MKCPHCSKDIAESIIMQEASRINGRKSKRVLTKEEATNMSEKRWGKKEDKNDDPDA